MAWPQNKRSLHIGPKVKPLHNQPLPNSCDSTSDTEWHSVVTGVNNAFDMLELSQTTPVADNSDSPKLDTVTNSGNKSRDKDKHNRSTRLGHLQGAASSVLEQSIASFMSWADEEVEYADKIQTVMDEIDNLFYDGVPTNIIKDEKLMEFCLTFKNDCPQFRLLGTEISKSEAASLCPEPCAAEKEEIIASHGVYVEPKSDMRIISSQNSRTLNNSVRDTNSVQGNNFDDFQAHSSMDGSRQIHVSINSSFQECNRLHRMIKKYVMEQLTVHVLTEAVKHHRQSPTHCLPQVSKESPLVRKKASKNESAIYETQNKRTQRMQSVPFSQVPKISDRTISRMQSTHAPDVNASNMCMGRGPSFSIISLPKHDIERVKLLDVRGYHSAAIHRTGGLQSRRYSCISMGTAKFLKPMDHSHNVISGLTVGTSAFTVPNSPIRWQKHTALPPINSTSDPLQQSFADRAESEGQVGNEMMPLVKPLNKVLLLPVQVHKDSARLKMAKDLLDSMESSCRLGVGGFSLSSRNINKEAEPKKK